MKSQDDLISELFLIRNKFGAEFQSQKKKLLLDVKLEELKHAKSIREYHDVLLFILAYPDNKEIHQLATKCFRQLEDWIQANPNIQTKLFNSGITGSEVCGSFGFEVVKWLRSTYKEYVFIDSMIAEDGQIMSILSVVMPLVESEILQDANTTWQLWLKQSGKPGQDLLDKLIDIFDQSEIRPEVKDELWGALSINVIVRLGSDILLPSSLTSLYYHKSIVKKVLPFKITNQKLVKVEITVAEAKQIINSARMILVRHIREIDPISFSDASLVGYYQLSRGMSIALFRIKPQRRRSIDCYMGYVAFKNGLPVSYAGSWVLFDSGRIGLNIFSAYRGGESLHTFEQILYAHQQVHHLNRFSVDPYQIGKHNNDGIHSGAFWLYHKLGFTPIKEEQKKIAEEEFNKIKTIKGYRSPAHVLLKLADSRLELVINPDAKPVRFDATDLSKVYSNIIKNKYGNDRKAAEEYSLTELVKILQFGKFEHHAIYRHILKNWCVILMVKSKEIKGSKALIEGLKKIFQIKAQGSEDDYMLKLQNLPGLKKLMVEIVQEHL